MPLPANAEETTPLSYSLLFAAAEKTWLGQVPTGSPSSVVQRLHDDINGFPCLQGHTIVDDLLGKLDRAHTNRDVLTTTEEIFEQVGIIRNILEKKGILHPAQDPRKPLIALASLPNTDASLLPPYNIERLHKNAVFMMTLHFTSQVLAILGHVADQIKKQALQNITPIALVDAQPIAFSGEIGSMQKIPTAAQLNEGKTSPQDFVWQGVTFNKRMKLIPILASLYLENAPQMSQEELKRFYKKAKAGESDATDENIYQLLRNIRLNFEQTGKSAPFTSQKGKGIQFKYDIHGPETIAHTDDTQNNVPTNLPENTFLDAPFDPQSLFQPLQLKKLTEDAIQALDLDDVGKNILRILLEQTRAIRVADIATQCEMEVAEVNAHLPDIMNTLCLQQFAARIDIRSDHIYLVNTPL